MLRYHLPMPFSFDGDFPALAALMQSSWSENREQPLLYTPDFLRSAFAYPGASFDLAPAIYDSDCHPERVRVEGSLSSPADNSHLIAFGAAFPRTIRYNAHTLRLALDSFITVSPAHKGKRLGGIIWGDLATRVRDAAYDGLITFTVEGDRMNAALPRYSAERGLNTAHVLDIHYLARPLAIPLGDPVPGLLTPAPIDLFLACAAPIAQTTNFARLWTAPEAQWQCASRYGALSAALQQEDRAGVLSGYLMQTAATSPATVAILDDILWDALSPAERHTLLRGYLQLAKQNGAALALTPLLHYADLSAFSALSFRRSKRLLHMYLTSFTGALPLAPLPAAYIDVF